MRQGDFSSAMNLIKASLEVDAGDMGRGCLLVWILPTRRLAMSLAVDFLIPGGPTNMM